MISIDTLTLPIHQHSTCNLSEIHPEGHCAGISFSSIRPSGGNLPALKEERRTQLSKE